MASIHLTDAAEFQYLQNQVDAAITTNRAHDSRLAAIEGQVFCMGAAYGSHTPSAEEMAHACAEVLCEILRSNKITACSAEEFAASVLALLEKNNAAGYFY